MQTVEVNLLSEGNHTLSEAYKALRTNVQFCGSDIKTIVMTSCMPNEGKSNTALELSAALAETGKKVLFIDADLRKSVMARRLRVGKGGKGLSQLLSGMCTMDEALCATSVRNLHMIFSGPVPPNPAELLGGKLFSMILNKCRDVYDYIIIDTAPLGSVIDAAVAANFCDGAVMVMAANEISYRFAQNVKGQLEKSDCKILGVVLNKMNMKSNKYYGRYYGRYYGKYYGQYGDYGNTPSK